MTSTTDTHLLLRAFVDELARCGMRNACTSPGSRNAPLILSLAREARLHCFSHVDERCAGFFALGLAKASGLPVAVTCTSGTAAAQLLAPAIEAREARVPLLLLTADRPAELRENGAGQAIDQLKMYGSAAKWFFEVELPPVPGDATLRWIRTLACRAYATTLEGTPGAVHLNFPLREPLVSDAEPPEDHSGRPDGMPFVRFRAGARDEARPESVESDLAEPPRPIAAPGDVLDLAELISGSRRGIVVAGRHERLDGLSAQAAEFARAAGWPLLADPLSGARRGEQAIAHYDAILRVPDKARELAPDFVLRLGDLPVSKPLRTWLAGLDTGVQQVAIDPEGTWQDPAAVLSHVVRSDPATTLAQLAGGLSAPTAAPEWIEEWRTADRLAATAIDGVLGSTTLPEAKVSAELGALLPDDATLFVASSMPVRDIETFWPARAHPPRVLCNRGANGIDGIVSSAFGAAAACDGEVVLLIGDVALAHDIGGLLAAGRLGLKVTIVLIDNNGGGIFSFLPVATAAAARAEDPSATGRPGAAGPATDSISGVAGRATDSIYSRHIATPTGLEFSVAADLYGLEYERAPDRYAFRTALERALARRESGIVEVPGTAEDNVTTHARVWEAVAEALSPRAAAAAPGA